MHSFFTIKVKKDNCFTHTPLQQTLAYHFYLLNVFFLLKCSTIMLNCSIWILHYQRNVLIYKAQLKFLKVFILCEWALIVIIVQTNRSIFWCLNGTMVQCPALSNSKNKIWLQTYWKFKDEKRPNQDDIKYSGYIGQSHPDLIGEINTKRMTFIWYDPLCRKIFIHELFNLYWK